ncbi:unnamed protein product [Amaranthus hypochondriacus]
MSELPDELWRRILELGVQTSAINTQSFSFKDLCCISISCKRLYRLSNEDSLWSSLLSADFPSIISNTSSSSSSKELYKSRYEKDKARRIAAHKRAVIRIESRIAEHSRKIKDLQVRLDEETQKMKLAASELSHLHKVRQASVALNVWQPEIIRGRQKQMVEQCAVPVDSRINALQMELKLCKQHLIVFQNTYRDEKKRLEEAKEVLMSMKYHPLQEFVVIERKVGDPNAKRKKLKSHITG